MGKRKRRKIIWIIVIIVGVFFLSLALAFLFGDKIDKSDKVAIIPIKGIITIDAAGGFFEQGIVSSTKIVEFIENANKDKTVKVIILEINSPGGTVVSSKEIANAVNNSKVPVIAWIREVGASGAYWIASSSDYIISDKLSITGSIGVTSSYLEFSELFDEYGITYESLTTGKYKDLGSPFKELSNDERNLLLGKLNIIHDEFVKEVAENRGLGVDEVREIATGVFLLGMEAKDLGLVDELGGKDLALEKAKELSGSKKLKEVRYETKGDFFGFLTKESFYFIGKGIGSNLNLNKNFIIEAR